MLCFDSNIPLNPDGDLDKPFALDCAACGVSVSNGPERLTHQGFHDRVEPVARPA